MGLQDRAPRCSVLCQISCAFFKTLYVYIRKNIFIYVHIKHMNISYNIFYNISFF